MRKIYLDYAATTPVDPRVLKAMMPYFSKRFGNSMSLHSFGVDALDALEESRKTIADVISADPQEIIFTSSATESNNLALKGVAFANKPEKKHIIVSKIEHDCVLESSKWLERQGFKITRLPVDHNGFIDLKDLKKSIRKDTALVSIIHASNEIGTIQDIRAIGQVCHKAGVYFHTDASQSFGKEKINVRAMNIDLLTASSHKIYGPKGAGILFVKKGIRIEPILHGGGHENGVRSSTSNVPAIVGMAKASQILFQEGEKENQRIRHLRDTLIHDILVKIKGTKLNGDPTRRLANNVNVSIFGIEGESMVLELDYHGIAVSTGSACSSRTLEPSHVLTAIGLSHKEAHGSLRISLGRFTKESDIKKTGAILEKVVKKLRSISPVPYE
jgi:cysteine desulfurase